MACLETQLVSADKDIITSQKHEKSSHTPINGRGLIRNTRHTTTAGKQDKTPVHGTGTNNKKQPTSPKDTEQQRQQTQ
jgi:hypothetical protein